MLKSCLPYLGSPVRVDNNNVESKIKDQLKEAGDHDHGHAHNKTHTHTHNNNNSPSFVSSNNSKHIFVRVVHAGGKVDHYPNAVLAAKLLESLPGKWLTHPQVFKQPHQSIIYPEDYLLPGHKYYVIPLSTIDKLMRKHNNIRFIIPQININMGSEANTDHDAHTLRSMDDDDFSFCYARDFYANEHKRSTSSISGSRKPRILLPVAKPKPKPKPNPKQKPCSAYSWEPGLTSIQELSP